jgi:hypothetical protein
MKATDGGKLTKITNCYIMALGATLEMQGLPEITDSKSATYSAENIIGRSTPLESYSHSDARTISWEIPFYVTQDSDITDNLASILLIQSLVYPSGDANGSPPPTAQIQCGKLLGDKPLCVFLKNYSIRYGSDVAWDEETMLPYKCIMSTTWEVVYSCSNLPTQRSIFLGL